MRMLCRRQRLAHRRPHIGTHRWMDSRVCCHSQVLPFQDSFAAVETFLTGATLVRLLRLLNVNPPPLHRGYAPPLRTLRLMLAARATIRNLRLLFSTSVLMLCHYLQLAVRVWARSSSNSLPPNPHSHPINPRRVVGAAYGGESYVSTDDSPDASAKFSVIVPHFDQPAVFAAIQNVTGAVVHAMPYREGFTDTDAMIAWAGQALGGACPPR